MTIIGCDPGITGAFFVLKQTQQQFAIMPTIEIELTTKTKAGNRKKKNVINAAAVKSWLEQFPRETTEIMIELVGPMPNAENGAASLFSFGEGFGLLKGIFVGMGFRMGQVRPQRWQADIMRGRPKGSEAIVAAELFPGVDWRASDRCRKPHSGLVDAALIGEYARRVSQASNH